VERSVVRRYRAPGEPSAAMRSRPRWFEHVLVDDLICPREIDDHRVLRVGWIELAECPPNNLFVLADPGHSYPPKVGFS